MPDRLMRAGWMAGGMAVVLCGALSPGGYDFAADDPPPSTETPATEQPPIAVVPPSVKPRPTVTSIRTRMGPKGQVFLYPPTGATSPDRAAVLFFSGDWGWRPLQQEMATRLAAEGRYVAGIDATEYFGRRLEPSDWRVDLRTLRTFLNEKAGRPAEADVLLIGFTFGGELVPYMINRGGAAGFIGALLVAPDREGAIIYRVSVQLKMPTQPEEAFDVESELRRLPPTFPIVLMEGELDTLSAARALTEVVPGPKKFVTIEGADRQFRQSREAYFSMVGQALGWMETQRLRGNVAIAPEPIPVPKTVPPVEDH